MPRSPRPGPDARDLLGLRGWAASREVVRRVRAAIPARLELAALFGSRARGEARPDSDVDLLLLFRALPPDREPHATHAEQIAEQVARETGIPVSVWSVSLADLERGCRTPMLVDALDDALPVWPADAVIPRVRFSPEDALYCARCLLRRVEEGSREVADSLDAGEGERAAERARDDLVRLCTATLLLHGHTRPRGAEAVRAFRRAHPAFAASRVLDWAEGGCDAPADRGRRVRPPPSWGAVADTVAALRRAAFAAMEALSPGAGLAEQSRASHGPTPGP